MSVSDLAIVAALVFGWGTLSARLEVVRRWSPGPADLAHAQVCLRWLRARLRCVGHRSLPSSTVVLMVKPAR